MGRSVSMHTPEEEMNSPAPFAHIKGDVLAERVLCTEKHTMNVTTKELSSSLRIRALAMQAKDGVSALEIATPIIKVKDGFNKVRAI